MNGTCEAYRYYNNQNKCVVLKSFVEEGFKNTDKGLDVIQKKMEQWF